MARLLEEANQVHEQRKQKKSIMQDRADDWNRCLFEDHKNQEKCFKLMSI